MSCAGENLAFKARWTPEVYYDILTAIHLLQRAGRRTTLSNIGQRASVPNLRLKDHLGELLELGLLDADRSVTKMGYDYCVDYRRSVDPFLRKYGLRRNK